MIKSIKFTGVSGYITKKIPEPECPVRGYDSIYRYRKLKDWSPEEQKLIKKWKMEHKEWEKHKDDYLHPELVSNLIGRKFEFQEGKINLIFGPNASGKTTIIKAIAGNAGTEDGFTTLKSPLTVKHMFEEMSSEVFRKYLDKQMENSAEIEWDGSLVYYDNFANRKNYGSIGDLCGSVLGDDIMTEVSYIMNKGKISQGQNSIYLLNRLMDIGRNNKSFADLFSEYLTPEGDIKPINKMKVNDVCGECYKYQLEYYLGMEKSKEKSPTTFLFDEIDKSMDMANIFALYTEVLPKLVEETGVQIIIISHSPIVLSEKIRNSQMYNFISIDEAYTEKCVNAMKKLF